jgi:hypothetical protein
MGGDGSLAPRPGHAKVMDPFEPAWRLIGTNAQQKRGRLHSDRHGRRHHPGRDRGTMDHRLHHRLRSKRRGVGPLPRLAVPRQRVCQDPRGSNTLSGGNLSVAGAHPWAPRESRTARIKSAWVMRRGNRRIRPPTASLLRAFDTLYGGPVTWKHWVRTGPAHLWKRGSRAVQQLLACIR